MSQPIRYYDRYARQVLTEQIYGERWLRWAYETRVGRLAAWLLFKRAWFSHWYGWRMNRRVSAHKVLPFILDYGLDVDEFARQPTEFRTFNEFFYRALKPSARPIAPGDDVAVFPADGRHLVFPNVDEVAGFYVKGQKFTLASLLGDEALAREFAGGSMVISRLCPVDYHRFHFPVAGTPGEPRLINGVLYSVSPVALRPRVLRLVENKRALTLIELAAPQGGGGGGRSSTAGAAGGGRVAMLEVGATCVGTIRNTFMAGRPVAKGAEKGFFAFGGSCVITLFQRGRIRFDDDLVEQSGAFVETYARMGDRMGVRA
ncbi:phosphatidylserine decarboxylase [Geminisphaera colitermitum]|uniref:phosphatidylserine decarboxylase n=1 Tax=Geminisphaera colitermitum TaxID=1148786 RepID=UPI0005BDEDAB|nr:phosphatidylserine decarboxylase [Geminisphaera colitermitum]